VKLVLLEVKVLLALLAQEVHLVHLEKKAHLVECHLNKKLSSKNS
jgi:hypothetical protein